MDKIGLIAGGGNLPILIAKEAVKNGYEIFAIGFEGFTSTEIGKYCPLETFKLGKIDSPIQFLKKNNVNKVIMIGNIPHINIFSDLRPDIRAVNLFLRLKDKSPKGIFSAIQDELKKENIEIVNSALFMQNSMAKEGIIAGGKISPAKFKDVKFGFEIAKKIAAMDIGLSIIVRERAVIAVEAIEGTDECIKRAGKILKSYNLKTPFTLVKVARPDQDMRFDLPVIGSTTINNMADSGGDLIAVEADKTLIVDVENAIKTAIERKVTIIGIKF